MFNDSNKIKSTFYVIAIILSVWIIFTELIFAGNKIFPSSTLILISIYDLFKDYKFLSHLISTISVVYLSIIAVVLIVKAKFSFIDFHSKFVRYFLPIPNFFSIVPEIIIGLLLIFWLGDSYWGKLIYAMVLSGIMVYQSLVKFDENKITDKIIAAKSLGISDQIINRKIIWKYIEPEILNNFLDKHTFLWSSIIAYEYIQNFNGVGFVLRNALQFNDLSIIISIIILFAIIIFISEKLLLTVINKYFVWN